MGTRSCTADRQWAFQLNSPWLDRTRNLRRSNRAELIPSEIYVCPIASSHSGLQKLAA